MNLSNFQDWSKNMSAPKIFSVQALENKKLRVNFVNGIEKIYDCSLLLGIEMFQLLKNEAFFKSVRVDPGGYGISWNDDADLSEYELWVNGVEVGWTVQR
jgi:hypothetical protein